MAVKSNLVCTAGMTYSTTASPRCEGACHSSIPRVGFADSEDLEDLLCKVSEENESSVEVVLEPDDPLPLDLSHCRREGIAEPEHMAHIYIEQALPDVQMLPLRSL